MLFEPGQDTAEADAVALLDVEVTKVADVLSEDEVVAALLELEVEDVDDATEVIDPELADTVLLLSVEIVEDTELEEDGTEVLDPELVETVLVLSVETVVDAELERDELAVEDATEEVDDAEVIKRAPHTPFCTAAPTDPF